MVKIQVLDVNDNLPIFYPRDYNVSLRERGRSPSTSFVVVAATDMDSGRYGDVRYKIVSGNTGNYFRIDETSGELFVTKKLSVSVPLHVLNITAVDGGGLSALETAQVSISVLDSEQMPPVFLQPRYSFAVREDVETATSVGTVNARGSNRGKSNKGPCLFFLVDFFRLI